MARSVWWRGGAVRLPLLSSRNASSSRTAICSTENNDVRAAASSIASGTPSRLWQMSTVARKPCSPSCRSWRTACARSRKSPVSAVRGQALQGDGRLAVGYVEPGTRHTASPLTRSGSRLVVSTRNNGHAAGAFRPAPTAGQHVLAIVEHQRARNDRRSASQIVSISGRKGCSRSPRADATPPRRLAVGQRRQLRERDPARVWGGQPPRRPPGSTGSCQSRPVPVSVTRRAWRAARQPPPPRVRGRRNC